jgi:formylglycine-generating enzyme required for sulfatase activity
MSRQTWFQLALLSGLLAVLGIVAPGWTRAPSPSPTWLKTITNTIGMKLVGIPPGKFKMGSTTREQDVAVKEYDLFWKSMAGESDPSPYRAEGPQHDVEITKEFWLGVHEVTQKQFKDVMGYNPSYFSTDGKGKPGLEYLDGSPVAAGKGKVAGMDTSDFPVENVSWQEANEFCQKLTAKDKKKPNAWVYRLPTEAEWEYACRGGTPAYQVFHFGDTLSPRQANFDGNYPYDRSVKGTYLARTCKVGSYKTNRFGLYDMHGNVQEWCADWYDESYYGKSPAKDPHGPAKGSQRVIRGGNWDYHGKDCRSAARDRGLDFEGQDYRFKYVGFRVALGPPGK